MYTDTLDGTISDNTDSSTEDIIRQILVVVATVSTLVVNALSQALPLNGQTIGEISDSFDVFFVPAGYVFSIWSLIYLGLIGYSIYQALPSQRTNPLLRQIGWFYILSAVANCSWVFLWHYNFYTLSVVAMVTLLVTLIMIYRQINAGDVAGAGLSGADRWLVQVPFSTYLGWITVATIANVTSALDWLAWSGWGIAPAMWAVIMLAIGTVIGLFFSLKRQDIAYGLVLVWAFAGIVVEQGDTQLVATSATIAAAVMAVGVVAGGIGRVRKNSASRPA